MAEQKTLLHSLGLYFTNGVTDDLYVQDEADSLGGEISLQELDRLSIIPSTPLAQMIFLGASGKTTEGEGTLRATSSTAVAYAAPGDALGTAVTIADGETKMLLSDDADQYIVVKRDGSTELYGESSLDMRRLHNNVLSLDEILEAERAAGSTKYRAIGFKNHAATDITDIKVWMDAASSTQGLAFGFEAADESFQTIANETTAPSAPTITYVNPTSEPAAQIATLTAGKYRGLWLRRTIGAAALSGSPGLQFKLNIKFTISAVTYTEEIYGYIAVQEEALELYQMFVGEDTAPTIDTTSATLPFSSSAVSSPVSGTKDVNVTVKFQNAWGLVSFNEYQHTRTIDTSGEEDSSGLTIPYDITVEDTAGGGILVSAKYDDRLDGPVADKARIWISGDGTSPDPTSDTPVAEIAWEFLNQFFPSAVREIRHDFTDYTGGQALKVLVTTYRTQDDLDSTNTTATSFTVGSKYPKRIEYLGLAGLQSRATELDLTFTKTTLDIDTANSIYWEYGPGFTSLYGGGSLIFKMIYDSSYTVNNGFWTVFGVLQEQVSGAGTEDAEAIEVQSWGGGTDLINILVNGTRRMAINATNSTISVNNIQQISSQVMLTHTTEADPALRDFIWDTTFQVYDISTHNFVSMASLDHDGNFNILETVGFRAVPLADIP